MEFWAGASTVFSECPIYSDQTLNKGTPNAMEHTLE